MRSNFWLIRPTGIKEREDTNKGIKETLTQKNIPKKKKEWKANIFPRNLSFFQFQNTKNKDNILKTFKDKSKKTTKHIETDWNQNSQQQQQMPGDIGQCL